MMNKIKLNDASVTFMFPSKLDRLCRSDARDASRRGRVPLDNVIYTARCCNTQDIGSTQDIGLGLNNVRLDANLCLKNYSKLLI